MLHDVYIMLDKRKFIKASEYFSFAIRNGIVNNEVSFYIPGLRFLYNKRREFLTLNERIEVAETCLANPPLLIETDTPYTTYELPDEEMENFSDYDIVSIPNSYYQKQLLKGDNVLLLLPKVDATISLQYYGGDYLDPVSEMYYK